MLDYLGPVVAAILIGFLFYGKVDEIAKSLNQLVQEMKRIADALEKSK